LAIIGTIAPSLVFPDTLFALELGDFTAKLVMWPIGISDATQWIIYSACSAWWPWNYLLIVSGACSFPAIPTDASFSCDEQVSSVNNWC